MSGPCDEAFEGETHEEVGKAGGAHIMNSTDEAHAEIRDRMAKSSEEDIQKWWAWFKDEWDKKEA